MKNFGMQLTFRELTCLENKVLMFLVSPSCFHQKMERYQYHLTITYEQIESTLAIELVSFVHNTTAFDCYDSVSKGTFPLPYQYSRCLLSYACLYN